MQPGVTGLSMNVGFDHLSLSAKDPEGMRDFLSQLLGLEMGDRPGFSFDGFFLFAGDKDIVHIFNNPAVLDSDRPVASSFQEQNIVHHICFHCDNRDEIMRRIDALNLAYSVNTVPGTSMQQIFVRAPENLLIEIQVNSNSNEY